MAAPPASMPFVVGDDRELRLPPAAQAALSAVEGPLYPVGILGDGRSGKSTLCNAIVCSLAKRGLLRDVAPAVCQRTCQTFTTGSQATPVTIGSNICILPLRARGAVLLLDCEGLLNGDRDFLNLLLGLVSQCSSRLIFVTQNVNDTLRASIARLVLSTLVKGPAVVMPHLHVVVNVCPRPTEVFATTMNSWFAGPGDAAAMNQAFPPARRDVVRFRPVVEVLDQCTGEQVLASTFGIDLEAWLTAQLVKWLAEPFRVGGVEFSGAAYALFLQQSIAETNAHVAAGRVLVQPATNLAALVAGRCLQAANAALDVYERHASRPLNANITGLENWSTIQTAHNTAAAAALAAFDSAVPGLQQFAGYVSERTRIVNTLADRLRPIQQHHTAQKNLRALQAQKAAADAARKAAEEQAERERKQKEDAEQRAERERKDKEQAQAHANALAQALANQNNDNDDGCVLM